MSKREPLKVGDRVRVYGGSQFGKWLQGERGTVEHAEGPDHAIGVQLDTPISGTSGVRVRPEQCRRLKPRQPQAKERAEFWSELDSSNRGLATFHGPDAEASCKAQWRDRKNNRVVRLLEVKESERPVSREELRKACEMAANMQIGDNRSYFEFLRDELGFPSEDA